MKSLPLLLAASVAANAVLLAVFLARPAPPASASAPSSSLPASTASARPAPTEPAALAPAALRDHLRTLGLAPVAINALVRARIYARHDSRRRELLAAAAQSLPWWKAGARTANPDSLQLLTPAQRKELHDLEAAARAETLAQLGPAALDPDGKIAVRFAFLSPEKAVLLEALENDYRNLTAELRDETRGTRTSSDREKEKLLVAERLRDIAALLTPAERDDLDLHASPTAGRLSGRMLAMQVTEEEYRAIFALQQAFDAPFPLAYEFGSTAADRPTAADRENLNQKLRAVLGDARYADWESSAQAHTAAIARLALTNNLPPQTVRELNTLLADTANKSWGIGSDTALTPEQRQATLARLAADTRTQVSAQLGPDTATALLRDIFWIDTIANGGSVRLTGGGFAIRGSSVRSTPPAASPAPAPAR